MRLSAVTLSFAPTFKLPTEFTKTSPALSPCPTRLVANLRLTQDRLKRARVSAAKLHTRSCYQELRPNSSRSVTASTARNGAEEVFPGMVSSVAMYVSFFSQLVVPD